MLSGAMRVAYPRRVQGPDLREGVITCAKHFLGYAVADTGQNMSATAIGPPIQRVSDSRSVATMSV